MDSNSIKRRQFEHSSNTFTNTKKWHGKSMSHFWLDKVEILIESSHSNRFILFHCSLVEQNTDDILNTKPEKSDKNNKFKSQEDVEETVSKCKFFT